MIELKNLSKQYGPTAVLQDINLTIESGEFFVLVGPSGSGKTTTLKIINRLVDATSGGVAIDGQPNTALPLRQLRLDIGYVLQQIALFPNLTVRQNIDIVPAMKKWPKKERARLAEEWLEKVGLPAATYRDRYPRELSGGEQQRVGIIRALIGKPRIVLMDEPFSALDPISRRQLQELIKALHSELQLTIVFVTHDMAEAAYVGDRLCVMEKGRIVQIGTTTDICQQPKNEFVANFFKLGGACRD